MSERRRLNTCCWDACRPSQHSPFHCGLSVQRTVICAAGCQRVGTASRPLILRRTGVGRHWPLGDLPRHTDIGGCSGGSAAHLHDAASYSTGTIGPTMHGTRSALTDRASVSSERTANGSVRVLETKVGMSPPCGAGVRGGHSTTSASIEVLFNRTDVLTWAAWTPRLRFAADTSWDFAQVLLLQEAISVETPASDMAADAWVSALSAACQTARVSDAERQFDATRRITPAPRQRGAK